jgi:Leucine-rich repeat (LRR) protein
MPNLRKLSLAGNGIKGLIPRLLFGLKKLEYLDLSGNPLGQLDPDILVDVPNLKVIKFR